MSWWKKLLNIIPLVFAGYEVGKSVEEADSKALIQAVRENNNNNRTIEENSGIDYLELGMLLAIIFILIIFLVKRVKVTMNKRINRIVVQEQQRI